MTNLLNKAVKRLSKLSEIEQDEIAKLILDEIEDEESWNNKFKNSQGELQKLAEEAVSEFKSKKTKSMNF